MPVLHLHFGDGSQVKTRYNHTYKWNGKQCLITTHHLPAMPEKQKLYCSLLSSARKPTDACEPSQNGLFLDAPHRHNVTRLRISY